MASQPIQQRRFLLCLTVFSDISVSQSLAIIKDAVFSLCSPSCTCAPSAKITRRLRSSTLGCCHRRQPTCATMSKNIKGAEPVFCRPFTGPERKTGFLSWSSFASLEPSSFSRAMRASLRRRRQRLWLLWTDRLKKTTAGDSLLLSSVYVH